MIRDDGPINEAIDRAAARDWRDHKARLAAAAHQASRWADEAALVAQGPGVLRVPGRLPAFLDEFIEHAIDQLIDAERHLLIRLNGRCSPIPLADGEVVLTAYGDPHFRRHRREVRDGRP